MEKVFKQFLLPFIYGTLAAILLLVTVQLPTPVNAQEPESEFWAVIIGVADYENLVDLNWADDDARDLADQLSPAWGDDHIKLLTDSMATKQNIENAVTNWLAQREDANDVVLFFYSGRTYSYAAGYLATHDSLTTSYANDISTYELNSWLGTLDSEHIVLMNLDGDFLNALSGTGRIVLTPNAVGEDNWATSDLDNGVFTNYILEALHEFEAADSNNNFKLSVEEIFNYAKTRTTDYTASNPNLTTQHPQISDRYGGELDLLIIVTADVDISMAQETNILSVDGKTYSSQDLPVSFIWAPGSHHDFIAVSSVSGGSGIRYVFNSWGDGNASVSRTISLGGAYTASYITQYYLTFESDYGQPQGAGWYDEGYTATISIASVEEPTVRHNFIGWSGDYTGSEEAVPIIMTAPKTITADWRNEYLLTIESAYGEPEGAGWYDEGSTANISVSESEGVIVRQFFTGWSGDYSGDTASASVIMDEPKTVTADWRTDYIQLYMVIIGIVVILGVFGFWFIKIRRRTARISLEEITQPPPSPMQCASCGAEIEPGDAFCIKCGEPVKGN